MVGNSHTVIENKGASAPLWERLFRHRSLRRMRWLLPLLMAALVVVYEFVVGHMFQPEYGRMAHELSDILIFGTVGPVLTFVLLDYLDRFVQERETSDLQADLLRRTRREADSARELIDEAIQIMFSTSTLIDQLKESQQVLPAPTEAQIAGTEKALDDYIRRLRGHLMSRR